MKIFGKIFRHALGQRCGQNPLAHFRDFADFIKKIINLRFYGTNFDRRVQQACGTDHLLGENAACLVKLPVGWGGGDKNGLRPHRIPFLKLKWAVVHTRRQSEPMFGKGEFTAIIALIHCANLRHADVAFIGEDNGIVGDELKQCRRRLTGCAPGEIARIIFNAAAYACRFKHLKIEICALFQPLRFK